MEKTRERKLVVISYTDSVMTAVYETFSMS